MGDEVKTGTGATPAVSVPDNLKKFIGVDGTLDVAKLSQGYLEAERMAHSESQRRSDVERAYAVLAEERQMADINGGGDTGGTGRAADAGAAALREKNDFVRKQDVSGVVDAFIETIHPEVAHDPATGQPKNPEFFNGLKQYVATLPQPTRQSIANGDFQSLDWAIKSFKAAKGGAAGSAAASGSQKGAGNFMESSSAGAPGGKKIWTRAEIRALYNQNPVEYAKQADEISQAYEEGRVK